MNGNGPTRPGAVLLLETGFAMILASIVIRMFPLARLRRMMVPRRPCPHEAAPEVMIATLRRAIEAWSRRLPWRTMCFEQGLTAHWLLRRRGFVSTLSYGAVQEAGELKAHVWVRSGSHDVIGCEIADQYVALSHFSTGSSS